MSNGSTTQKIISDLFLEKIKSNKSPEYSIKKDGELTNIVQINNHEEILVGKIANSGKIELDYSRGGIKEICSFKDLLKEKNIPYGEDFESKKNLINLIYGHINFYQNFKKSERKADDPNPYKDKINNYQNLIEKIRR